LLVDLDQVVGMQGGEFGHDTAAAEYVQGLSGFIMCAHGAIRQGVQRLQ
jgi:hypothetical protein